MSKETEQQEVTEVSEAAPGTIGELEFQEAMSKNFLVYAWSTLLDRALPQIDGLKPVHRRVILAMKDLGLTPKNKHKKSALVVGHAMGRYHPHGDASIYDALVRMSQSFSMRVPLVDGQGNFGSIDGNDAAAMRYTESRMSPSAEEMIADLHPKIIPDYMGRNYDESFPEAELLPIRFPNLLINGSYGIATGMTTFFLPHNPAEAIDLCSWRLKNPDATVKQAIKRLNGPDLPTGGLILNDKGLEDSYLTGKGKVTALAKAHVEKGEKGKDKIIITELPWMVNKGGDTGVLMRMAKQFNEGKYPEFENLQDFSAGDMRIEIQLKRGVNSQMVLNKLLKNNILRRTYSVEMNCVVDDRPKTINLLEVVDNFLDFRRYVVVKRAEKRIEEIEYRLYKLDAYMKVISATDKVVQIIKKAKSRDDAKPKLMKLLKIDEQQAQWIVEMQLGSLTQLDSHKIKQEIKDLKSELKELLKFIKTEQLVTEAMIEEFNEVKAGWKKQGLLERRSALIDPDDSNSGDILEESSLTAGPAEEIMLMVSHSGKAINAQGTLKRGGSIKLGADDHLITCEHAKSTDEYLIFSDQGKAYRLRLAELPLESKRVSGEKLASIIGISLDEKVVAAQRIDDKMSGDFFFTTKLGMFKRVAREEFKKTHASGVAAMKINPGDSLLAVADNQHGDKAEILMVADNGKMLRTPVSGSRVMGRAAGGVKGMKLADGEQLIAALFIIPDDQRQLLLMQAGGFAKRIALAEIPSKGRGGGGVAVGKIDGKYGQPVAAALIDDTFYLQDGGKLKDIKATKVAEGKRATTAKPFADAGLRVIDYLGE